MSPLDELSKECAVHDGISLEQHPSASPQCSRVSDADECSDVGSDSRSEDSVQCTKDESSPGLELSVHDENLSARNIMSEQLVMKSFPVSENIDQHEMSLTSIEVLGGESSQVQRIVDAVTAYCTFGVVGVVVSSWWKTRSSKR